jgi:hypothetical protein
MVAIFLNENVIIIHIIMAQSRCMFAFCESMLHFLLQSLELTHYFLF